MNLLIFFILINSVMCQITILDRGFLPLMRLAKSIIFEIEKPQDASKSYNHKLINNKVQTPFPDSMPFFCDINGPGARSKVPPTSVHKLTPGDIDIVAAIGDSLTAANGVWSAGKDPLQIVIEGKGVSFSIGGQDNWRKFLTIPNILKEFNPNLYGYSVQSTYSYKIDARFNVAEPIAMSADIFHQTQNLLKRMKSDSNVDLENHWKLITILIGGNDFCLGICYHSDQMEIIENHDKDLTRTLRFIKKNFPRTMVNVVLPPDVVSILSQINPKQSKCSLFHYFECPCVFSFNHRRNLKRTHQTIKRWKQRVEEITARVEFHNTTDFTVNLMPFSDEVDLRLLVENRDTDMSFLSYDCFHPSQKGAAISAVAYWLNMLEPSGNKTRNYRKDIKNVLDMCPTAQRTFLATNENSRS